MASASRLTRRNVIKSAALGTAAAIAAPYVRGAYAAGTLTLVCWDHWVPGANTTLTKYGKVADDADAFINGEGLAQLSDLIGEMRRTVANLDQLSGQLNKEPTKLLFGDRRKGYTPP